MFMSLLPFSFATLSLAKLLCILSGNYTGVHRHHQPQQHPRTEEWLSPPQAVLPALGAQHALLSLLREHCFCIFLFSSSSVQIH